MTVEDNFIIVIDTREQNPYFKRPPKGLIIVRDTLECGDYSLRGFEKEVAIERKELHDFLTSISHERYRFKAMLSKMADYKRKFLVIEATLDELTKGVEFTPRRKKDFIQPLTKRVINMHPNAVYQTVVSIMCRYGVCIYFAEDRREGEKFVYSVLKKFYSLKRDNEL